MAERRIVEKAEHLAAYRFSDAIGGVLRRMDSEACTTTRGYPTGLNWYGGHFEPQKKRPRTEVCWSQRLAQLLPGYGFPTRAEVPYPALPRCKCDSVVTLEDGSTLWLETKGAWKEYWRRRSARIYRSYLLHPLVEGLDPKTHTVPLDLQKLASLSAAAANHVGVLLVGFDSDVAPMDRDMQELVNVASLGSDPWRTTAGGWADPYRAGCNVRFWFWWRPVEMQPRAR